MLRIGRFMVSGFASCVCLSSILGFSCICIGRKWIVTNDVWCGAVSSSWWLLVSSIWIVYSYPFIADRFIPLKPRSFLFTIPMIVVIFLGCQYLDRVFQLHTINEYSKKTYVFMLIQHIMINTFMWNFDEQKFSKFWVLFSLLLVFGITMYLSGKIVSMYKPIENSLLHKME